MPRQKTIRYRAAMGLAYSVAMLALMEYARSSTENFTFGPMTLEALEDQGLAISGTDLEGVQRVLAGIPGLYISDD